MAYYSINLALAARNHHNLVWCRKTIATNMQKTREKKTQETLTLAVGLWPRTRIAKVLALLLVAMRILLRGIGGRQAVGEAGDGGQALLVRSWGRRSHGYGCQEELRRQRN